ncbi:MAG: hypothetical protein R2786_07435 [Flavobacteriaceae bacterium]
MNSYEPSPFKDFFLFFPIAVLTVHFCLETKTNQKIQEGIKVIFGNAKTAAVANAACFLFAPQNALPLAPPSITGIPSGFF